MKKRWKRLTALALALIMCVQPVITAHAIDTFAYSKWPVFNTNGNETYLKRSMVMCQGQACEATGGVIERVVLPANISDIESVTYKSFIMRRMEVVLMRLLEISIIKIRENCFQNKQG